MIDAQQTFEDLGVDAVTGSKVMGWLNLNLEDLVVPIRFSRLQSCIKYLKQFPEDTQRFIIHKSTSGKMVDKLDHLFEYTNLLTERVKIESELKRHSTELSIISGSQEVERVAQMVQNSEKLQASLRYINEEITIYEK